MKKNDIILILIVLIIAAGGFYYYMQAGKKSAGIVRITVEGSVYKEVSLDKDQTIKIKSEDGDENVVEIKDGAATMTHANCPDQICIHQTSISKNGEMIVCLPHQVVVTVVSDTDKDIDSVAN